MALLVSLRVWAPLLTASQACLRVRGDSVTALRCAVKMASSAKLLNGIGAEIALTLELHDIDEVITVHVPGVLNDVADRLSRLAQPKAPQDLPSCLRAAKKKTAPERSDALWLAWSASTG